MSEDDEVRDENRRTRAPAAEVVRAPATPGDYPEAIRGAYRDTVEGIFRMGRLLIDANEDLLHGEFESMVEEDLPFGPRSNARPRWPNVRGGRPGRRPRERRSRTQSPSCPETSADEPATCSTARTSTR